MSRFFVMEFFVVFLLLPFSAFCDAKTETVFSVPAPTIAQTQLATWKLDKFSRIEKDGRITIEFKLPPEVLGEAIVLHFSGSSTLNNKNLMILTGPKGELHCGIERCELFANHLTVKIDALKNILGRKKYSPAALAKHLAASELFEKSQDAIIVSRKPSRLH